jgi:G patch domain and KOW motifs-containing protein
MATNSNKLSFSFSKTIKKNEFVKAKVQNVNVEIIESIEGKQMKIVGKDANESEQKLIIPMTNDQKTRPIARLIEKRRNERNEIKTEEVKEETLEQRAAREIIEDLQKKDEENKAKIFELPLHPDKLPLNGANESTLNDYESVPISDFGKAMLRGMGWKEEAKKDDLADVPVMRPKGLGLGADKVIKKQPLLIAPTHNETLEIKKNACVKILAGKHKNMYGTVSKYIY